MWEGERNKDLNGICWKEALPLKKGIRTYKGERVDIKKRGGKQQGWSDILRLKGSTEKNWGNLKDSPNCV